jgi:rfaE bifunctional protein kinase chain/domain
MAEIGIDYYAIGRPYVDPQTVSVGERTMSSLREVVPVPRAQLAKSRVLVVGDVMLDRYWFGDVDRISPEAPVPVVHVQRQEERLGGAANVARNVGARRAGGAVRGRLRRTGRADRRTAGQQRRHAASRTRRGAADHHQAARAGTPAAAAASTSRRADARSAARKLAHFDTLLPQHNVVLLSDYAKGGLTHDDDDRARARRQPVLVDPKGDDWARYRGASLITPNRAELREVIGHWKSEDDLRERALLRAELDIDALLLTRSEEDDALLGGRAACAGARARGVRRIGCGRHRDRDGGDDARRRRAACRRRGAREPRGGIVVGKLGTATVDYDELFH